MLDLREGIISLCCSTSVLQHYACVVVLSEAFLLPTARVYQVHVLERAVRAPRSVCAFLLNGACDADVSETRERCACNDVCRVACPCNAGVSETRELRTQEDLMQALRTHFGIEMPHPHGHLAHAAPHSMTDHVPVPNFSR